MKKVMERVNNKTAWRIDKTENYYLSDFCFPKIKVDGVI